MRRTGRMSLSILLLSFLLGAGGPGAGQRPPPGKPERSFAVYVCASPTAPQEEQAELTAAAETVKKRIRKRKKWLRLLSRRDEAEIIVEIVRHTVEKQHINTLESRVSADGTTKEWVDVNYLREHHFIEARVTFFRRQQILTGADVRERGGSAKRAADDLAKQIEGCCKESYWELIEMRPPGKAKAKPKPKAKAKATSPVSERDRTRLDAPGPAPRSLLEAAGGPCGSRRRSGA